MPTRPQSSVPKSGRSSTLSSKTEEPAVNQGLRSHVTRVGFDLSLGRTHIAALVWLNEVLMTRDLPGMGHYIRTPHGGPSGGIYGTAFANHATGVAGLITRGLALHHYERAVERHGPKGVHDKALASEIWTITRAGQLVVELLKEAGLYQEYAIALYRDAPRSAS